MFFLMNAECLFLLLLAVVPLLNHSPDSFFFFFVKFWHRVPAKKRGTSSRLLFVVSLRFVRPVFESCLFFVTNANHVMGNLARSSATTAAVFDDLLSKHKKLVDDACTAIWLKRSPDLQQQQQQS